MNKNQKKVILGRASNYDSEEGEGEKKTCRKKKKRK